MQKKCILISFTLVSIFLSSYAQIDTAKIFNCRNYNKGLYKNYNEFINNSPSLKFDFTVLLIKKRKSDTISDRATFQANDTLKAINDVWGFCDGKDIYIKYPVNAKKHFCKLEYVGAISFFRFNPKAKYPFLPAVARIPGSSEAALAIAIVNLVTIPEYNIVAISEKGEFENITYKYMRQLLSKHTVLLNSFNEKVNQYGRFRDPNSDEYRSDITHDDEENMVKSYLIKLNEELRTAY